MLRNNRPARQAAGNPAGTASSKPSRLIEQACLDGGCAVVSVRRHGFPTHNRGGITVIRRRRIARAPTSIVAMAIRSPTDLVRGRGHAQASLVDDRHHTGAGRKRRESQRCAYRTGRGGFCERRHLYLLQLTRENLEVCSRSFFFSPGPNVQLVQLAEPSRPRLGAFRSLQRKSSVSRELSCRRPVERTRLLHQHFSILAQRALTLRRFRAAANNLARFCKHKKFEDGLSKIFFRSATVDEPLAIIDLTRKEIAATLVIAAQTEPRPEATE